MFRIDSISRKNPGREQASNKGPGIVPEPFCKFSSIGHFFLVPCDGKTNLQPNAPTSWLTAVPNSRTKSNIRFIGKKIVSYSAA